MTVLTVSAEIFACHSAACRPPGSGGTGGSGGGGGKAPRVRGGKTDPIAAKLQAKGKFVPGHTPIADTTRIKDGAVHVNGKQVTGKITKPHKTYGGYQATMRGAEHSHWDKNKKKRVQNIVIGDTKMAVARAAQEAVMMAEAR